MVYSLAITKAAMPTHHKQTQNYAIEPTRVHVKFIDKLLMAELRKDPRIKPSR
jgi:hypothetical protein